MEAFIVLTAVGSIIGFNRTTLSLDSYIIIIIMHVISLYILNYNVCVWDSKAITSPKCFKVP